jgi:methyl coenzyme M reductase subunit C
MIRIIIGPDAIKKEGLDRVTKSVIRKIRKLTNENHCEILFFTGVTKSDISYTMRHILRIFDIPLTIMTQVSSDNIKDNVDQQGNELEVTIKVT